MTTLTNTDWTKRWLDFCEHIAQWSKDPSTKVGAVLVNHQRQVVGFGYNGFPRGVRDLESRYENKEVKYKMVVHSEANAILNANASVKDTTLYCTKFPCTECTKLIIQSGINKVVTRKPGGSEHWIKDSEYSRIMLHEAGIILLEIEEIV